MNDDPPARCSTDPWWEGRPCEGMPPTGTTVRMTRGMRWPGPWSVVESVLRLCEGGGIEVLTKVFGGDLVERCGQAALGELVRAVQG